MAPKITTIVFLFLILSNINQVINTKKAEGLILKLIHYKFFVENYHLPNRQANIFPDKLETIFLVEFFIGSPAMPQLAVMDTGSSVLWVNCYDCPDFYRRSEFFNPAASFSFDHLLCEEPMCKEFPNNNCGEQGICKYNMKYASVVSSSGFVGSENFSFLSNSDNEERVIIFGCNDIGCERPSKSIYRNVNITGIFGLGNGRASFVSQMGYNQFSYCIRDLNDSNYQHNKLILGDSVAYLAGDWMRIEIYLDHYYVPLEKIQLGDETIDVESSIFKRTSAGGGVLIDTGSQFTYLVEDAYNALRDVLDTTLEPLNLHTAFTTSNVDVCFFGTIEDALKGFPLLTLSFAGSIVLDLEVQSVFYQLTRTTKQVFCLAILPSSYVPRLGMRSLIGLMAQQNYNWGYDLTSKKIFFQNIDCALVGRESL